MAAHRSFGTTGPTSQKRPLAMHPPGSIPHCRQDAVDCVWSQLSASPLAPSFEQMLDKALRNRASPLVDLVCPGHLLKVIDEPGQVRRFCLVGVAAWLATLHGHVDIGPGHEAVSFVCREETRDGFIRRHNLSDLGLLLSLRHGISCAAAASLRATCLCRLPSAGRFGCTFLGHFRPIISILHAESSVFGPRIRVLGQYYSLSSCNKGRYSMRGAGSLGSSKRHESEAKSSVDAARDACSPARDPGGDAELREVGPSDA